MSDYFEYLVEKYGIDEALEIEYEEYFEDEYAAYWNGEDDPYDPEV